MVWGPVVEAEASWADAGTPAAQAHATEAEAASAQAREVFLAGNDLPARWAHRRRFVVLETDFGGGHNFLATWAALRRAARPPGQLVFVAIAPHPPSPAQLRRAHLSLTGHGDPVLPELAEGLIAQWPHATPDLHVLDFDAGRLRLILAFGDAATVLPELVLQADAIYLDGPATSLSPSLWEGHQLRHLHRLAAPGATLASLSTDPQPCQALLRAGFELRQTLAGPGRPAFTVAQFKPRHVAPPPPGRRSQPQTRSVAVVGAGLAGAAVARALAAQGLAVQVFERHAGPALETSGNAAGLFHSIVHVQDGHHARWLRAAALHTERVLRPLIEGGAVPGAVNGLWRGEHGLDAAQMQALLARQHQPTAHVQVRANGIAGAHLPVAGWWFAGGGWVSPAALASHWLKASGAALRYGVEVASLQALDSADPSQAQAAWCLRDNQGCALATVDAVVLCNPADVQRLLTNPAWALRPVRGQTTILPASATLGVHLPWPVADAGYALRLPDGRVFCGGASQPDDSSTELRDSDHAHNLAGLRRLTGWAGRVDDAALIGRAGVRWSADDRLPISGPVAAWPCRATQLRFAERQPGLHVFTALGSRGITQAALGAELLAARLTGAPSPLPSSLIDALDPARFAVRALRRGR